MREVTLKDVILTAIRAEELGAKIYEDLAVIYAYDSELKGLFEFLAEDEEDH